MQPRAMIDHLPRQARSTQVTYLRSFPQSHVGIAVFGSTEPIRRRGGYPTTQTRVPESGWIQTSNNLTLSFFPLRPPSSLPRSLSLSLSLSHSLSLSNEGFDNGIHVRSWLPISPILNPIGPPKTPAKGNPSTQQGTLRTGKCSSEYVRRISPCCMRLGVGVHVCDLHDTEPFPVGSRYVPVVFHTARIGTHLPNSATWGPWPGQTPPSLRCAFLPVYSHT